MKDSVDKLAEYLGPRAPDPQVARKRHPRPRVVTEVDRDIARVRLISGKPVKKIRLQTFSPKFTLLNFWNGVWRPTFLISYFKQEKVEVSAAKGAVRVQWIKVRKKYTRRIIPVAYAAIRAFSVLLFFVVFVPVSGLRMLAETFYFVSPEVKRKRLLSWDLVAQDWSPESERNDAGKVVGFNSEWINLQ